MSSSRSTSSRALSFFSERVEDATEAVKGLIGGTSAIKYADTSDDVVRAQLESDRDEVRLEGLKTVISLISKGREASGYFASVVKLSSNSNLEIRKLVYIVIRRYARKQPEIALLGINSFQRDLQDRNEVIRAMALRVLAGLRLKLAASVVEMAIDKCVRDSSFHVRKAAALALIKCTDISPNARQLFKAHIVTLLNDRNPAVLAVTLTAWSRICPDELDVLHPHYRKLCYALADMNEWGQTQSMNVLGHYAKRCLRSSTRPSDEEYDKDLVLLVKRCRELLHSQNAAVVRTAARLIYSLGGVDLRSAIVQPIIRLTKADDNVAFLALLDCLYLAKNHAHLFATHVADFIPQSSLNESERCTSAKLHLLAVIGDGDNEDFIVRELLEHAESHPSSKICADAVKALGGYILRCADEGRRMKCTLHLISLLKTKRSDDVVVGRIVAVICKVIENANESDGASYVARLASLLFAQPSAKDLASKRRIKLVGRSTIKSTLARATIYWLVGQHSRSMIAVRATQKNESQSKSIGELFGLDILRRAAINFAKEDAVARRQIVTLSTKLFVYLPSVLGSSSAHLKTLSQLHNYVLQLARYDVDFDVRDRGRLYKAMTERLNVGSVDSGGDQPPDDDDDDDGNVGGQREKLSGVVLRSEQVLHILFEKPAEPTEEETGQAQTIEKWDSLASLLGERQASSLSIVLPDFFLEPWLDPSALLPATVRDPPPADTPVALEKGKTSAMIVASTSVSLPHTPPSLQDDASMQPTPMIIASHAKYKDLDAFLNDEDDVLQPSTAPQLSFNATAPAAKPLQEEEGVDFEEVNQEDGEEVNENESESESEGESDVSEDSLPVLQARERSQPTPVSASFNEENAWAS